MLSLDEDALVCDLAETYHVYDWRSLPLRTAATLASGLGVTSRIKTKMGGLCVPLDVLIEAGIQDRLSLLVWAKTKDAQHGRNRPAMLTDELLDRKDEDSLSFASGEDFERFRAGFLDQGEQDG